MVFKKILLFILVISIFTVPGNSLERKKPLPLKELQNPKSPSYVPIPYPRTDEEVIADLKYYFKKRTKTKGIYSVGDCSSYENNMRNFLEGKGVIVGEILKIKNELAARQRDYIFFIRLKTKDNIRVADINMDSDGRYLASSYLDNDVDMRRSIGVKPNDIYEPYLDKKSIIKQFRETLGYELNKNEINGIRLVEGQSYIANGLKPACEITFENGSVFYFTFKPKALYSVESVLEQESRNFNKSFSESLTRNQDSDFFVKSKEDKVLILKKLWTERREKG